MEGVNAVRPSGAPYFLDTCCCFQAFSSFLFTFLCVKERRSKAKPIKIEVFRNELSIEYWKPVIMILGHEIQKSRF